MSVFSAGFFLLNFCTHYIKMAGVKCKFWITVLNKWTFHTFPWVLNWASVWWGFSLSAASCRDPAQLCQLWGEVRQDAVMCQRRIQTSSQSCPKARSLWMKPDRCPDNLSAGRINTELWKKLHRHVLKLDSCSSPGGFYFTCLKIFYLGDRDWMQLLYKVSFFFFFFPNASRQIRNTGKIR